jgi:hypothetical protein
MANAVNPGEHQGKHRMRIKGPVFGATPCCTVLKS